MIVHFPIALLLIAPVLVIAGLIGYRQLFAFSIAALILMSIGTATIFLAAATGEASAELAGHGAGVVRVLDRHEEMAETCRWVFGGLTALFAAMTFVPQAMKRPLGRAPATAVTAAYLGFYFGGALLLANTAHEGGRLVHEFGVQAAIAKPAPSARAKLADQASARDVDDLRQCGNAQSPSEE